MFYFFSKTITYLLMPAGWLMTALILAFFTKKIQYRRRLIGIAFGIFWLFGNPFLTNELALWWEYPIQSKAFVSTDSTTQIAVLLTGGMINAMKKIPQSDPARLSTTRFLLGREADRAGQALYLYKTGLAQKILISGGSAKQPFLPASVEDEGQMTTRFLVMAGVRPDDIILENRSRNTHENAIFSTLLLRQRFRTNRCILVTSAWHMRRAMACFRKAGVVVNPFPGSFISRQRSFAIGEWLLPHEESFFDSYYLIRELVGYATYKLMGYV